MVGWDDKAITPKTEKGEWDGAEKHAQAQRAPAPGSAARRGLCPTVWCLL